MAAWHWLSISTTRSKDRHARRMGKGHASRRRATRKLCTEQLEERLALSGFGPEDGAYIVEPWTGGYSDVQIQPGDQKIVAAGSDDADDGSTDRRMAIARYDSLGNPDNTYGSGGPSIPPLSGVSAPALGPSSESGWDLVLQPNGKAVVAGNTAGQAFAVARFNTNGSLDGGFDSDGWNTLDARGDVDFYNTATGVGLQSTGKVVVAGFSFTLGPGNNPAEVARFTAGGAIDSGKGGFGQVVQGKATGYTLTTFGVPHNTFSDLAVQLDDKLVAVGMSYNTDVTQRRLTVARYTASGTLDKTFNGSGYSLFLVPGISDSGGGAVALQSIGGIVKIVVAGSSTGTDGANDMLVARYNPNGTLDASFGGGSGYVRLDIDGTASMTSEAAADVAIQPDGKIVVGGSSSVTGNPSNVLVARFNVDGTPDATFATGGFKIGAPLPNTGYHSFQGTGVALQSDGSIIVAGSDDWDATDAFAGHPLLMRFAGTPASPLRAAGGAAHAPSHTEPLTLAQVQPLLTEAIARWQATGANVSALGDLDIRITDLGAATLGLASGSTIWLDDNAAGWGWFVDATLGDDSEFTKPGNQGEKDRMDLLTVLGHEIGHLFGHDHDEDGVMAATLAAGTRLSPTSTDYQVETVSGNEAVGPLTGLPAINNDIDIALVRYQGDCTTIAAATAVRQSSPTVTVRHTPAVTSIVTIPSHEAARRRTARTEAADQAIASLLGSETRRRFGLSAELDLNRDFLADLALAR